MKNIEVGVLIIPQVHERISDESSKGAVFIFYNYKNVWNRNTEGKCFADSYTYVMQHRPVLASFEWTIS